MPEDADIRIPGYAVERPLFLAPHSLLLEVKHTASGARLDLSVRLDVPADAVPALRQALAPLAVIAHPNVARYHDVVAAGDRAALLVEHVEGPPLLQALADEPFTVEQADDLGRGILAGLQALHDAGFTHPGIAPHDVLLSVADSSPVPKIVGAGVAAAMTKRRGDVRDDVRAVGMLLHALVTGRVPGPDETLVEVGDQVPDRIVQALRRALRVDVDQRGQSAREVLAVWEGAGETGTGRVAPARAWDERAVKRLRTLWSERPPVAPLPVELAPRPADPDSADPGPAETGPSRIPALVLIGMLAFLLLLAWWGGR